MEQPDDFEVPVVTGNEVADFFLAALDARIEGRVGGHPPDSRERMARMRPMLRARVIHDPEALEAFLATWDWDAEA